MVTISEDKTNRIGKTNVVYVILWTTSPKHTNKTKDTNIGNAHSPTSSLGRVLVIVHPFIGKL